MRCHALITNAEIENRRKLRRLGGGVVVAIARRVQLAQGAMKHSDRHRPLVWSHLSHLHYLFVRRRRLLDRHVLARHVQQLQLQRPELQKVLSTNNRHQYKLYNTPTRN